MVIPLTLWIPLAVVLGGALIICTMWLFMVFVTACLALATWCRQRSKKTEVDSEPHYIWRSGLFQGRVGHTRFHPKRHSFSYPLYIFMVDLDEVDDLLANQLWPLSKIVSFQVDDHMKQDRTFLRNNTNAMIKTSKDLAEKIFQVVQRDSLKTIGNGNNDNMISSATHRILLVTQLSYWGYCFNPVSFYYLQNKITHQVDVMVAEVSNTPWGEMHEYVLRQPPQKRDDDDDDNDNDETKYAKRNYKFDKSFHVSPFMEMNYVYDWTFQEQMTINHVIFNHLDVITSMKTKEDRLQFTARMQVQRQSSLWCIVLFLLQYPMFCLVIQIWIHYEAFWLFVKGIPYHMFHIQQEVRQRHLE